MAPKPTPEYGVYYLRYSIPTNIARNTVVGAWVELENTGALPWRANHAGGGRVDLVILCDGEVWATHQMPLAEVNQGDHVTIHFALHASATVGRHMLKLDLVEQGVTMFEAKGVKPLEVPVHIIQGPVTRSTELYQAAAKTNPWHYQPSRGIHCARDGGFYPLFAEKAKGCYLWDVEGRRYLDYVMGWGCALLGYNDPRIQNAVIAAMDCAPVMPLPHPLEIEVSQLLIEDIPCAEMAVFGKNGSDVCTVAARLARSFTGRKTILYCGYHGWQDWWAEQVGFANSGIPERPQPILHRFRFNNLADFTRLFDAHRADLAAVMLEPAGPAESRGGPFQDADRDFLTAIAGMCADARALLIFDEVMTGFRYPGGSVQKATGVIPSLACFGKGLGAGMPISALVGRADIFHAAMNRTHYGPTFRGEVYSLAAARAAIDIYRREPVADHIWRHGQRLKLEVNQICADLKLGACMTGPPFRMVVTFQETDASRLSLKRALYQQELLKARLITYDGIMLPCYAHDDKVLIEALGAIRGALGAVARAERDDNFDAVLELPPS
jgi:glutamate-1-semialdehyde aminotransferase